MDKLVYEFKGMKEATNRYSKKVKRWTDQSDSMQIKLKELYNQIHVDSIAGNKTKLERDIQTFLTFKQSYTAYLEKIDGYAENEDREMTLGIINQLKAYIEAYAEKEGFDLILLNTQQQNVGFAKKSLDVTVDVLEFANKNYEGER